MRRRIVQRVLERLQARRVRLPLVVTEVGMARAGGDDQVVVVDRVAVGQSTRGRSPSTRAPRRAARGRCGRGAGSSGSARDVARRKRRRRDLIQQRLEDVVIPPIEQRDRHVGAGARARRETAEAAADDHDVWIGVASDLCHSINANDHSP